MIQTMYDLIEVYVSFPTTTPDHKFLVPARPVEFAGDRAIRYVTTSPHNGSAIDFHISEMTCFGNNLFIGCPETGIGVKPPMPRFEDPFQNPFAEQKLSITDLDEKLIDIMNPGKVADLKEAEGTKKLAETLKKKPAKKKPAKKPEPPEEVKALIPDEKIEEEIKAEGIEELLQSLQTKTAPTDTTLDDFVKELAETPVTLDP